MNNRKRTIILTTLLALAAITGAVYLWLEPSFGQGEDHPEPNASQSSPKPTPTQDEPEEAGDSSDDWSTPITPACGEVLTETDLDSALEFTGPPEKMSPESSFPVTVHNTTEEQVIADLDRYDFAVPVLTDDDGTVVAMGDLEPVLAEGYSVLAIDGGDEIGASGTLRWTAHCEDDPGTDEPGPIPDGDYTMFLLAFTGPFDDVDEAEQIQGGPFPITVDTNAEHEVPADLPQGGGEVPSCGQEWAEPFPLPGQVALADVPAVGPGDDLSLAAEFSLPETISGASIFAQLVILDGEETVGPLPPASDNLVGWYASAGAGAELAALAPAVTCEGEPLAAGEYEALVAISAIGEGGPTTLAVSERVALEITE